ncbi:MAG: hypothetical protein MRZ23_05425 [Finegoldia magna]|nr:hypothetical protein [Finegoldia magna]
MHKKKILAIVTLTSLIMGSFGECTLASNNYNYSNTKVKVEEINDNKFIINSEKNEEILTIRENDLEKKIEIKDTKTGRTEYIIYNKQDDSVYSSYTGNTIYDSSISFFKSDISYSVKYISFAQMREALGNTGTAGGVLGLAITLIPGGQGIGGIIGTISTIMGGSTFLIPKDSKHGLKFTIKTTKMYRSRLGKRHVYKRMHDITSVRRY